MGNSPKRKIKQIEYYPAEVRREWYHGGALYSKENYFNRVRHGLSETYFPNGQLAERANYVNGKLHGLLEIWWDGFLRKNFHPCIRANYVDGFPHGLHEEWEHCGSKYDVLRCKSHRSQRNYIYEYDDEISDKRYLTYQTNKKMILNSIIKVKELVNITLLFL